jgi:hypothetical protein
LVELEVTEDIGEELDDIDLGSSYSALTKATAVALTVGIISGGGLVFLQNGSPTTLGYDLAMQALLQQHQTAVGTAYGQAVQTAVATGKYTKQQVQNMPVFFVFKTGAGATPQIWQNDANAMAGKGTKGGASAPDVVNYFPGINATNRPAALGWARSVGIVAGNGQSLDEYPFASTVEGGVTPWLSVAPVAAGEQSAQGLNLSAFYGTQGFKPFTFLVVLVP